MLIEIQNNKDLTQECICCGKNQFIIYKSSSKLSFPISLCNNCGLYIAGKFEDEMKKKTQEIYNKEYWEERKAKEAIDSDYTTPESLMVTARWKSQKKFCEPFISKKTTLLEIGAGRGQNLYYFQKDGYQVTGIEPDKNNVDSINHKLQPNGLCHVGFAENIQINGTFDIVWMSHVLEHVIRPDIVFKKVHEILEPDGLFFVEIPNCESSTMISAVFDNNPSTYGFTKKALLNLGKRFGFKEIKSGHYITTSNLSDKCFKALKKFLKINLNRPPFHYKITSPKDARDFRILFKKI